jgi:hypothetical protein
VENAQRLTQIGWLLLGIQLFSLCINAVIELLPKEVNAHFSVDLFNPSAIGLLAVLLIFVLAQIFRHGSEMRAELEATV